jgi:hypothetical protein
MENQEKETSIDYYFRITKNYAFNLGRLIEFYVVAKKMYDMEIDEVKKVAFEKGYEEGVKYTDGLISDEKGFPF